MWPPGSAGGTRWTCDPLLGCHLPPPLQCVCGVSCASFPGPAGSQLSFESWGVRGGGGSWAEQPSDCKATCPQQVLKGLRTEVGFPKGGTHREEGARLGGGEGEELPAGSTQVRDIQLCQAPVNPALTTDSGTTYRKAQPCRLCGYCFPWSPQSAGVVPPTQAGLKQHCACVLQAPCCRLRSTWSSVFLVFFPRHLRKIRK